MYLSLSEWTSRKPTGTQYAKTVAYKASPTVLALGVVSMLTDISSESVAAVLPLYITGALGLSMVAYGFFEGMNQSISAIVRIGAGYAADRSNRPKPIAVAGYGLSMAARIGLLFATGFGGILAVIGTDRIGKGIRTAPRDAMIQEASQPEHLARSFGLHRLLDTVGATLGPLLAFAVMLMLPGDYRMVFVVSLATAVLGVAVLALLVPNRKLVQRPASGATAAAPDALPIPRIRDMVRGPLGKVLLAAGFLGLLTIGDGFIYLALMEHGKLEPLWFPLLFVGSNLFFLVLAVPMGKLADRTSRAGIFVLGHVALAVAYLCASAGGSLLFVIGALAFLGTFYAATDGVLAALAGQLAPTGATSTAIGTAQTVVAVARLLASTGFGVLWMVAGSTVAMLLAAGLVLALVPVAWRLVLSKGSEPKRALAS